jgi:hypothetical protein
MWWICQRQIHYLWLYLCRTGIWVESWGYAVEWDRLKIERWHWSKYENINKKKHVIVFVWVWEDEFLFGKTIEYDTPSLREWFVF